MPENDILATLPSNSYYVPGSYGYWGSPVHVTQLSRARLLVRGAGTDTAFKITREGRAGDQGPAETPPADAAKTPQPFSHLQEPSRKRKEHADKPRPGSCKGEEQAGVAEVDK